MSAKRNDLETGAQKVTQVILFFNRFFRRAGPEAPAVTVLKALYPATD